MKNQNTPRDELVCGKIDRAIDAVISLQHHTNKNDLVMIIDLLNAIRHDCQRMELKLVLRKDEVAELKRQILMKYGV